MTLEAGHLSFKRKRKVNTLGIKAHETLSTEITTTDKYKRKITIACGTQPLPPQNVANTTA